MTPDITNDGERVSPDVPNALFVAHLSLYRFAGGWTGGRRVLDAGCDFAFIGRAAMLRHDFPGRVRADPAFESPPIPISADHLRAEGLGEAFIAYMRTWQYFVAD